MAGTNAMANQLSELERKIDGQIAKARSVQTTTMVVGVILIVFIIGYFMFMASQVRKIMQPTDLAQIAGNTIKERVVELKPELEKAAKENAPVLVNQLVDEVVHNRIPEGRKYLEESIKMEAEKQLAAMQEILLGAFNETLDSHSENIREMATILKTEGGRQEFEDSVHTLLTEAMSDGEISSALDSYGIALEDINALLGRLSEEGAELSPEEELTRQLVTIVRELANRSKLDLGSLPTLRGIDEAVGEANTSGDAEMAPAVQTTD